MIVLCHGQLFANSLAMITQLLLMSIKKTLMLLSKAYQLLSNLIQNIAKFLIRYKEFYIKTTTKNLELIIYKLASKLMQKDERYKISKIMIVLYHGKVSTNSLLMTTQFL